MQIKNKIIFIFLSFLFSLNSIVYADEFDISANEISVNTEKNVLTGLGAVEIRDKEGKLIKANKVIYNKSKEFITAEGSVEVIDTLGNILKSNKVTYDKINEIISSFENSELDIKEGYNLKAKNIIYNSAKKILSSNNESFLTDIDGNYIMLSMFQYSIEKNLLSSIGKIKIIDKNKNKYFFKELHVDTLTKEMVGSDVSILFDQENFGLKKDNDPRLVANDISITKNKALLSKGVFTFCKKREDKCPPWSIKAKKISHDKTKKTIYYDHATLKV